MLTFITPRDRLLLRFLKPKVAAWRWFTRARRLAGMPVLRHEYLERVLNKQFQNYDYYSKTGGFTFEDGQYLLKLQTADGGLVHRRCSSLLEVATIVSFKFKAWLGTEVCNVPDFAKAALNARSPSDFIDRFLDLRRAFHLDRLRRLWIAFLTTDRDTDDSRRAQTQAIAGILWGNYESARESADVGKDTSEDLVQLRIDKKQAYNDVFELMRPLILKDLQLHRPHAYHLHGLCETEDELRRLLSGEMGFLRAKRALMDADQLDYMFAADLGL